MFDYLYFLSVLLSLGKETQKSKTHTFSNDNISETVAHCRVPRPGPLPILIMYYRIPIKRYVHNAMSILYDILLMICTSYEVIGLWIFIWWLLCACCCFWHLLLFFCRPAGRLLAGLARLPGWAGLKDFGL